MAGLIRTDRSAFWALTSDGFVDVDGPREGAVTYELRAVSPTHFGELSVIAKARARRAAKLIDEPSKEDVNELERWHLSALVLRSSIVGLHGELVPEVRALVERDPGRASEILDPTLFVELGATALRLAMVGESPFAIGSSTP